MRFTRIEVWVVWHLHPSADHMEAPSLFKLGCPMYKSGMGRAREGGWGCGSVLECLPSSPGFHPQYHIH